jgi:hypothetical protein
MTKSNHKPVPSHLENSLANRQLERLRRIHRLTHEQQVALIAEARAARLQVERERMSTERL